VRDAIPVTHRAPVAGARVAVAYATGTGPSTMTMADGSYRLDGIFADQTFSLNVTRDGYQAAARQMTLPAPGASTDVDLMPIVVNVQGLVTEAPPADATPVESAVVTIVNGPRSGASFATDATGAFRLESVWSDFDISVSRAGFETAAAHVDARASGGLVVRLARETRRDRSTFTGALCTTERLPPWLSCSAPFTRTHTIDVIRPGSLAMTVNYAYVGDYYPNSLALDILCGSRVVAQKKLLKLWDTPPTVMPDAIIGTFEVPVTEACRYDIRLGSFIADTKGGSQTTYRVDVDYPR